MKPRNWQQEQECQNRTEGTEDGRKRQPEQDCQNRTAITGQQRTTQLGKHNQIGEPGQDSEDKTERAEHLWQDCQDRASRIGHPRQNSQKRTARQGCEYDS
jgi:hypothetical protein